MGGTAPTTLIAADEEAVSAFLDGKIGFTEISSTVRKTLHKALVYYTVTEETVSAAEKEGREIARAIIAAK